MCGLLVIIQNRSPVDLGSARRALDSIAHRGPDAAGEWASGKCFSAIAGCRSSTLPPVTSRCKAQMVAIVIVFNGEIYNFLELREDA